MDTSLVLDIAVEAILVIVLVAAPVLGAALATGLLIGTLQAATSIQEMTLSFIPKLAAMVLALVLFGEWQLAIMIDYFEVIFERIQTLAY
ncbi:MAG: flagellar biosynthetic protein FliQ [Gammaproteobacteria bacterium]|nr:flagellar biosynthetic protein FliQ [Gammaproteobacteria bacterium]OUU05785.1 MAG: flagellar biosynthetic protein FliQ [Gammaproteobacteria bacterium TMED34]OUU09150.1 MAG: flagellar biosynthetic protein FliQ [Gammaproteobacteria bacterium TMED34]|tara:strand:+ start:96 stop:365 length:270 start_codon:yes stop_codon:yes gene_type:complete